MSDGVRARLRGLAVAAWPTAVVGLLAGIAATAGSYATAGFTPGFVAAPVAGAIETYSPDAVIRYAIEYLGSLGQQLNLLSAVALVVLSFGAIATAWLAVGDRLDNRAVGPALTGVTVWGLTVLLTGSVVLALGAGLPAAATLAVYEVIPAVGKRTGVDVSGARRRVLGLSAGVLGLSALGGVAGQWRTPAVTGDLNDGRAEAREALLATASEQSLDLESESAEPLVSTSFYNVDINAVDPTVQVDDWSLSVTGAVEEEVTVDYDALRAMPSEDRFVSLRCVGDDLNGYKVDNALWTGVEVDRLLEEAGPTSDCECVMLRAADGFYEEFPLEALRGGLIAFGMNGTVLPRGHGYPARALVPGHWGEVNVKWLTEIELLEREAEGYWEKKGWHGTGPVNTVAKIHSVADVDGGKRVGGPAYAGTRGIERVEVSTDGGDTWAEAQLSERLPDPNREFAEDAWRQWAYTYDPPGGEHEVVVRAVDGTGELQPEDRSGSYPSGASGWVSETVR